MRYFFTLFASLLFTAIPFAAIGQEQPPARVVVAGVQEREVAPRVRFVGIVDYDRIADVVPEVSGVIRMLHFREGQRVKQGDVLVELATDFIKQDILIKQKELEETDARLKKLKSSLDRLKRLIAANNASREAYEEALYDHQALLKERESVLAAMDRSRLELEKSRVQAPFDGVVLEKLQEQGEWVGPQSPVARLASTEDVIVTLSLTERLIPYQRVNTALQVELPALDRRVNGNILRLAPVADIRSRNAVLKISVPYSPGLIQNMSAAVEVPAGEPRMLRILPRDALIDSPRGDAVYLVENGKARMQVLQVAARLGGEIATDSPDIELGMSVVVDGNERLLPGQAVTIIDP